MVVSICYNLHSDSDSLRFNDNLEWSRGFLTRFGVVHTDFDNFERAPKRSAYFLKKARVSTSMA
jgi:beta-glucosidase/6-phospho-beta-glucosidase/beta-galactosidase